jgi:hypothetical protein
VEKSKGRIKLKVKRTASDNKKRSRLLKKALDGIKKAKRGFPRSCDIRF